MPEGLEVELYRRLAEQRALRRRIVEVDAPDPWFLKRGTTAPQLRDALLGAELQAARRVGKLLVLDACAPRRRGDRGATEVSLGLRFGMTGRLLIDETAGVEQLEYASRRDLPDWDRFAICFADGGRLRVQDPRRLGGVELEPDEARLGPDALSLTVAELRTALGGSEAPLKARLLDQTRIAGLGNLLVDEVLWRAGLDPARPAASLDDDQVRTLHRTLRRTLPQLLRRGGSHTGELMKARRRGALCPKDGTPLLRRQIGGRTTYSCPAHQW